MQEVTIKRALEGELERTVLAMRGVKSARVLITLPETGSFRRGRQQARPRSPSRPESPSDNSTARAIRHLVAAAVPGLTIDEISVLNTDGTVLAAAGDASSMASSRKLELEREVGEI